MTFLDDDISAFRNVLKNDPFRVTPRNTPPEEDDITSFRKYINLPERLSSPTDQPSILGEFGVGFGSGIRSLKQDVTAAAGVIEQLSGGGTDLLQRSIEMGEASRARTPEKTSFADIESLETFTRWAARTLGEQIPIVVSIIGTGGIGGIVGRMVAKGAITYASGSLMVARLAPIAAKRGVAVGAITGASTIETGATAIEHFEATGKVNPLLAIGAGIVKGSLEAIVPLAIGRQFKLTNKQTDNLLDKIFNKARTLKTRRGRIAAGFVGASVTEAATEFSQESIDIILRNFVDENYELLGPESRARLLESTAAGFLVGGILGGAAGGAMPRKIEAERRKDAFVPDPDGVVSPGRIDPTDTPLPPSDTGAIGETTQEEVKPSFDPANQGEHVSVASDTLTSADGAQVRVFHSGSTAVEAAAIADVREGRTQGLLGLDREAVDDENLIVDVADLSNLGEIDINNPRITFAEPTSAPGETVAGDVAVTRLSAEEKGRILETVSEARDAAELAENRARENQTDKSVLMNEARVKLIEAARAGVRIKPEGNESFMLIGKPPASAIQAAVLPAGNVKEGVATLSNRDTLPRNKTAFVNTGDSLTFEEVIPATVNIEDLESAENIQLTEKAFEEARLRGDLVGSVLDAQVGVETLSDIAVTNISDLAAAGNTVKIAEVLQGLRPQQQESILTEIFPMTDMEGADNSTGGKLMRLAQSLGDTIGLPSQQSITFAAETFGFRTKGILQDADHVTKGFSLIGGVKKENEFVRGPTFPSQAESVSGLPASEAAGEIQFMRADNAPAIGPNGKQVKYKAADHKPGEVYFLIDAKLTKKQKKRLATIHKSYTALIKKMSPELRIIFSTTKILRKQKMMSRTFPAGISLASKGRTTIGINVTELNDTVKAFSTSIHELGHAIFLEEFHKLDPGIKEKIISAYNRARLRASMGGSEFITKGFFGAELRESIAPRKSFMTDVTTMTGEAREYYLSFAEWQAEQFVQWASTSRKALDVVEGFYKGITRKIISYLRLAFSFVGKEDADLALRARDFRPENEVKLWLDSLIDEQAESNNLFGAHTFDEGEITAHEKLGRESSVTVGITELMKKLKIPEKDSKKLRESVDRIGTISKWGFNILQLAQQNPTVQSLQRYVELSRQWYNSKMKWVSVADQRVRQWKGLHPKQQDQLSKFIFEVDSMKYLGPDENPRHPTDEELAGLKTKLGLDDEAFAMYFLIRQDFNLILDKIEEVGIRDILETYSDFGNQEVNISKLKKEMRALRNRPYFPHSRFGDYVLSVRETSKNINRRGKLLHMEQFENRRAALAAVKRAQDKFPDAIVGVGKMPEEVMPFRGLPPTVLKAIKEKLKPTEQQKIWLDDLIAGWAPSASFRHNLSQRQDIPGFSLDAMRTYANYFWHGSNYLARIEFQGPLQQTVNDMRTEQVGMANEGIITDKRQKLTDFVQDHLNEIMNPAKDWAQLRSIAFIWWLGFSPASAALNFTQVPLVAYPYLASRYSDLKAANALRKAVMSIHHLYKGKTDKVPDILLKALDRAMTQGFIDESQATELAATANGPNLAKLLPGTMAQRGLMQFAHWGAWMFQQSEKMNRRVVFRAAWELALANPDAPYLAELQGTNELEFNGLREEGFSPIEARAYIAGRDAVDRTQYEYASWARPRFMRGRKGVIFTFFMFLQNSTYFAFKSPGATRYWIMMLFMAGMMGLPGAEDLASLAKLAARKLLGKNFDVEKEVRELVVDLMGENSTAADLILHGTSRVGFGIPAAADILGIPFPSFDMSANISLGQIIPGLADLGSPVGSFESKFSRTTTNAAGASLGIGINLLKALSDDSLPIGDFKRWERAMPRAMKNVVKAARFYTEGRERTNSGATVLNFDASDPEQLAEIVAQGLGFTPTRLARKWDRERMQLETMVFWQTRRTMLLRQYDHAVTIRSREAGKDVIAQIKRFNNEVPHRALGITGKELSDSRKARERGRVMKERGFAPQRSFVPMGKEIDRLFPEIDIEDIRVR